MTASPDPHVGLPSELREAVKSALPSIAIAIEEWLFNGAADDEAASAIADLIRPAFEAEHARTDRWQDRWQDEHDARLSAEAKLAQAVEALARAKNEIVRTADDLSMHSPAVKLVEEIAALIDQPALNSRAIVREAASAAARGETR